MRLFVPFFFCAWFLLYGFAQADPDPQLKSSKTEIQVRVDGGTLRVSACFDSVVHVLFAPGSTTPSPRVSVALDACSGGGAHVKEDKDTLTLTTQSLRVTVSRKSGRLRFLDRNNHAILEEPEQGGRQLKPTTIAGEPTFEPQQLFVSAPDEAYYGLGQRQEGFMNWRGIPVRMQQVDSQIAIPVVLSNKGYGVFWNNAARTDFNPTDQEVKIDQKTGQAVFTSKAAGIYGFMATGGTGREEIALKVNNETIVHLNGYLVPYAMSGRTSLAAHTQYTLNMTGGGPQASVFIKGPFQANLTGFRSEVGDAIDYYFFYGPDLNKVIADYRTLTGAAPMFPKWAYGFLQCRERYSSQTQLLDAAHGFRARQIPVDAMIQDWQYWGKYGWNAMRFDEGNYPQPKEMIDKLHAENLHFVISVWSKFEEKTDVSKQMKAESLLIPGTEWFDAFNPKARALYWSNMNKGIFSLGADGWWLDATEPEFDILKGNKTFLGPYPFYVTKAVYEGQRATAPDQRVFILTRAAYAGQQSHAAASWSGDIGSTWTDFQNQIRGGLNFTMSGIPYWTTDVGGFDRPHDQHESPSYHEILTRWFEYGIFCPLFRIHGNQSETEIWKYGAEVEANFRKYDELRYRLLPYIYSTAWSVTHDGYTMMRGLPLDYHNDPLVADIGDEFMFGPSLLVSPVTQPGATSRDVYLPKEKGWINFWSGARSVGGSTMKAEAPLYTIPVFVKAGSIIPLGPPEQYASQAKGPIELRVYTGADGDFTLYDDDGKDYNYEKDEYATTPIRWHQADRTLTIGPRTGHYRDMPVSQTFRVVWVRPGHGNGVNAEANPDTEMVLHGGTLKVVEPPAIAGR